MKYKINDKGFTLIELLMVVIILGMLALLLVPAINSLTERNAKDNAKILTENIKLGATNYASDNKFTKFTTCDNNGINITLSTLIDGDYLKAPDNKILNPITKAEIAKTNTVNVKYNCDTQRYEVKLNFEIK